MSSMRRREFLKSASAAAASLAPIVAVQTTARREASSRSAGGQELRIGTARYAERDYPIQPKDCAEVTLKDGFWKPKILTNATVTIPLLAARGDGRGLSGNVLQAAIQSLQTHPDSRLQALVDARLAALRSQPPRGNAGFELAAVQFRTTGRRDLLDNAIAAADALYTEFRTKNPPFSGGERDAINCIALYRVTRDRRHLDLAKHYLTPTIAHGYATIARTWRTGDRIELELPMVPQRVHASEKIAANRGRVALRYGALVYNIEQVDQDITGALNRSAALTAEWRPQLLGGVVVIRSAFADGSPLLAIPNHARYNRPSTSSGRPEPVEGRNPPPTSIVWMREG